MWFKQCHKPSPKFITSKIDGAKTNHPKMEDLYSDGQSLKRILEKKI